jgi:hypothetical protein
MSNTLQANPRFLTTKLAKLVLSLSKGCEAHEGSKVTSVSPLRSLRFFVLFVGKDEDQELRQENGIM